MLTDGLLKIGISFALQFNIILRKRIVNVFVKSYLHCIDINKKNYKKGTGCPFFDFFRRDALV